MLEQTHIPAPADSTVNTRICEESEVSEQRVCRRDLIRIFRNGRSPESAYLRLNSLTSHLSQPIPIRERRE